jgi:hypothetical protein
VEAAAVASDHEERVVDGDADPDHRRHVRDVDRDLEWAGEQERDRACDGDGCDCDPDRHRGRKQRAERCEQDRDDEREPDQLGGRELLARDLLEVRPHRTLADDAGRRPFGVSDDLVAQVGRKVVQVAPRADVDEWKERGPALLEPLHGARWAQLRVFERLRAGAPHGGVDRSRASAFDQDR